MNNTEKLAVADMIEEITSKGFTVSIREVPFPKHPAMLPGETTRCPITDVCFYKATEPEKKRVAHGVNLFHALKYACNMIRFEAGELDRKLSGEIIYEKLPLAEFGPNAACSCGCRNHLETPLQINWGIDWGTGNLENGEYYLDGKMKPEPRTVGTCSHCGQQYRLTPTP